MTITPEVRNEQSTYAEAPIGTKVEEIQREKSLQEATAEAGREEQQAEDRESGDKDREKEKKEENLPEESLRMASWVEVSNERLSAEEKSEAGAELTEEEARDQEPLEVEERSTGEAEKDQTRSVEAELAVMEEKWRVQCVINDTLKQRLADEEGRFRVRHSISPSPFHFVQIILSVLMDTVLNIRPPLRFKRKIREFNSSHQTYYILFTVRGWKPTFPYPAGNFIQLL
ncbi:hypothetical protein XENOCAPTIV_012891 [Xenoophorus captivus]|uniref:Uncharacterized protein n=1 Tax=Xenoophorus captivus TaxID=1517983 RepID=A0ABV0SF90_9TELE